MIKVPELKLAVVFIDQQTRSTNLHKPEVPLYILNDVCRSEQGQCVRYMCLYITRSVLIVPVVVTNYNIIWTGIRI